MKKLSVHSDGTSEGTVVIDEDGNRIEGIAEISINIDARDGVPKLTLDIWAPRTVITKSDLETVWLKCQFCGGSELHECDSKSLDGKHL